MKAERADLGQLSIGSKSMTCLSQEQAEREVTRRAGKSKTSFVAPRKSLVDPAEVRKPLASAVSSAVGSNWNQNATASIGMPRWAKDPTWGTTTAPTKSGTASMLFTPTARFRKSVRRLLSTNFWKFLSAFALMFAMFGGSVFVLFNIPDDPGTMILDCAMLGIMFFFFLEVVASWLAERNYALSFFFWMDVAGTLSMLFEISFMLGDIVDGVDTVFLRSARTAKLGARVGRVIKVIKILIKQPNKESNSKTKVLSQNLMFALATKVSLLTITLGTLM
jgi:hypothetical protein